MYLVNREPTNDGLLRRLCFDLLISSILGLMLFIPFIILLAAIYIDDPTGLPIFRQARMGKDEKVFYIYKLRTMYSWANDAPVYDERTDKRITRIGRYLRQTKIDEFLQLINIFRGEMNLVGPRPMMVHLHQERVREIPGYPRRTRQRPGMSGLAAINQGSEFTGRGGCRRQLRLDCFYIKHRSIGLDLKIMAQTLPMLAPRRNRPIPALVYATHAAE